jgi:hypothetical protein
MHIFFVEMGSGFCANKNQRLTRPVSDRLDDLQPKSQRDFAQAVRIREALPTGQLPPLPSPEQPQSIDPQSSDPVANWPSEF